MVRLRRDVLRRSTVGVIATHRAPEGGADNTVLGFDANLWFFQNVAVTGFLSYTDSPGLGGTFRERASYRGEFDYSADRYGVTFEHLMVGRRFDPQIGFLRRQAFTRNYGQARFSPRPAQSARIRKHTFELELDHIAGSDGVLESREAKVTYRLELNNSDQWAVDYSRNYEFLREPFEIASGTRIRSGAHHFGDLRTVYQFGPQRRVSGAATIGLGTLYDWHNREVGPRRSTARCRWCHNRPSSRALIVPCLGGWLFGSPVAGGGGSQRVPCGERGRRMGG